MIDPDIWADCDEICEDCGQQDVQVRESDDGKGFDYRCCCCESAWHDEGIENDK